MRLNFRVAALLAVGAAMILYGRMLERGNAEPQRASSQDQSAQAPAAAGRGTTAADFPRGVEQIYMIKCWMCHNEYAKTGPSLKDLAKRPKLISGPPVNEQTVSEVIRSGSQRMPSYRHTMSDQQLADLVSYLLGGKCCPDPDSPPANPQYRRP